MAFKHAKRDSEIALNVNYFSQSTQKFLKLIDMKIFPLKLRNENAKLNAISNKNWNESKKEKLLRSRVTWKRPEKEIVRSNFEQVLPHKM